jgi:hypothetical protein
VAAAQIEQRMITATALSVNPNLNIVRLLSIKGAKGSRPYVNQGKTSEIFHPGWRA